MISKLITRKKSYERMAKLDDALNRANNHSELINKKNQETLLTANRQPGVNV